MEIHSLSSVHVNEHLAGVDFPKNRLNVCLSVSGYRPGGTGLTSAAKNDIIKEKSAKNITAITDKAIDRVPQINIDGFTVEQNAFVQKQHQELLQYSKVNNGNKEVAFVFRKGLADRTEYFGTNAEIVRAINMFLSKNKEALGWIKT